MFRAKAWFICHSIKWNFISYLAFSKSVFQLSRNQTLLIILHAWLEPQLRTGSVTCNRSCANLKEISILLLIHLMAGFVLIINQIRFTKCAARLANEQQAKHLNQCASWVPWSCKIFDQVFGFFYSGFFFFFALSVCLWKRTKQAAAKARGWAHKKNAHK